MADSEARFRTRLAEAQEQMSKVLVRECSLALLLFFFSLFLLNVYRVFQDNEKRVVPLEEHRHVYEDKFAVADNLMAETQRSGVEILRAFGMTYEHYVKLQQEAKEKQITLRYESVQRCKFLRKETRKEETGSKHVREYATGLVKGSISHQAGYRITEWFWEIEITWRLLLGAVLLQENCGKDEFVTQTKDAPFSAESNTTSYALIVNPLILTPNSIFRGNAISPRRNAQVEAVLSWLPQWLQWCNSVISHLTNDIRIRQCRKIDLSCVKTSELFVPNVPFFPLLENSMVRQTHRDSLAAKQAVLESVFEGDSNTHLFGIPEALVCVFSMHMTQLNLALSDGLQHLEDLLRRQLIAAVGKVLSALDFVNFMDFHNEHLFKIQYRPKPFCYSVRREKHDLEGVISIELSPPINEENDSSLKCTFLDSGKQFKIQEFYFCRTCWSGDEEGCCVHCARACHSGHEIIRAPNSPVQCYCDCGSNEGLNICSINCVKEHSKSNLEIPKEIQTFVKESKICNSERWYFDIHSAARVEFSGRKLIHGWLGHQFSDTTFPKLTLVTRARQFSSYLILIGQVTGLRSFEPAHGFIVSNKDELQIPLILESLSAPQISAETSQSLSAEQIRFAAAYRAMQLDSAKIGICVIQIKPQMEKLLHLNPDDLTKEIRLTQDLLELFVRYNIPSDLLSFHKELNENEESALAAVKHHVSAMQEAIERRKGKEIREAAESAVESLALPAVHYTQGGTVRTGLDWNRTRQDGLLSAPRTAPLPPIQQRIERQKCYDLIDALSKSGLLPFDDVQVHMLSVSTHRFADSLMDTLVVRNVNPIEHLETLTLALASAVHGQPESELIDKK